MTNIKVLTLSILISASCLAQNTDSTWNKDKEIEHLKNRQDSSTWSSKLLKKDFVQRKGITDAKIPFPFKFGVFPVPEYNLLGENSFNGVGTGGNYTGIDLNDKKIIYSYFLVAKNNKIDFIAFLTANRDEFAIVNMRLFDLKYGRTILIAPQKDASLRSMQIEGPIISEEEHEDFVKKVLLRDNVKEFFEKKGNI